MTAIKYDKFKLGRFRVSDRSDSKINGDEFDEVRRSQNDIHGVMAMSAPQLWISKGKNIENKYCTDKWRLKEDIIYY